MDIFVDCLLTASHRADCFPISPNCSQIWEIADPEGAGFLDADGFNVALRMTAIAQQGYTVEISNIDLSTQVADLKDSTDALKHLAEPDAETIKTTASAIPKTDPIPTPEAETAPTLPSTTPEVQTKVAATDSWIISPSDKEKFYKVFEARGPKDGKLSGKKAKAVLTASKLPVEQLGQIWELSDMDGDGKLDAAEFSVVSLPLNHNCSGCPYLCPSSCSESFRLLSVQFWPCAKYRQCIWLQDVCRMGLHPLKFYRPN